MPRKGQHALLAALLLLGATPALAFDVHFDGYADLRLVVPSDQTSWVDGGLGKLRYGAEDEKPDLRVSQAVAQAVVQITPALMALAVGQIQQSQRTFFDVMEAYLRYRPVSTDAWRWSLKAGAFFPPVSLENTEIGWTSPWTITPSTINSWVGEELRTIGGEGALEWRQDGATLTLTAAVFGWNDPAGVLLADRGWALDDRITGLIDRPREPDATAAALHEPVPLHTYEALEIDGRPGWYAGASWDQAGLGKIQMLRYDNEADPTAVREQIAWRTDFWSLGAQTQIGELVLLAQGMTGHTLIRPSPFFFSDTAFKAAYLLAGWTIGEDWRVAGRFDVFSTDQKNPGPPTESEHGNALTAALNYFPRDWLRLTAEAIRVDSTRAEREASGGGAPRAIENQLLFNARFYLP
jgi:hypothetical protein